MFKTDSQTGMPVLCVENTSLFTLVNNASPSSTPVRIDFERFVDTLARSCSLESFASEHVHVFGSAAARTTEGSFWRALRRSGYRTHVSDRRDHCEKETSASLATHIGYLAGSRGKCGDAPVTCPLLVVVCGNQDLLPALELATSHGIRTHVFSMNDGLAAEVVNASHRNKLLTVSTLDELVRDFVVPVSSPISSPRSVSESGDEETMEPLTLEPPSMPPTVPTEESTVLDASSAEAVVDIFIDNSNIYISGAQVMAEHTDQQDMRFRVDFRKLTASVAQRCDDADIRDVWIFGSDTIGRKSLWPALRKMGFKTDVRDLVNGVERGVDHALVSRIGLYLGERARQVAHYRRVLGKAHNAKVQQTLRHRLQTVLRRRIAIVSGDRDILPALELAHQQGVEVFQFGWHHSMCNEFRRLPSATSFELDEFKWEFSSIKRYVPDLIPHKARAVVITFDSSVPIPDPKPSKLEDEDFLTQVCQQLCETGHAFQMTILEGGPTLRVLVNIDNAGNLNKAVELVDRCFEGSGFPVQDVDAYVKAVQAETLSRRRSSAPAGLHMYSSNPFEALDQGRRRRRRRSKSDNDTPDAVEPLQSAAAAERELPVVDEGCDDDGFHLDPKFVKQANRDRRRCHRKRQNASAAHRPCRDGVNCHHRLSCRYKHTDEEIALFRKERGFWNPKHRTVRCHHDNDPSHVRASCKYAHTGDKDTWCTTCRTAGHIADECVKRKRHT